MPDAETTAKAETIIHATIEKLLRRRGADPIEIKPESRLSADLGLDSLELAELSAVLEDEIGYDPYSEGAGPQTVAALIAYYDNG